MTTPKAHRAYRAPCPACGAPVAFLSAQSTHAVCSYCQSTLTRDADTLAHVGKMAELFEDHSPLQLMASGRYQEQAFTIIGRLQYQYGTAVQDTVSDDSGTWNEWIALTNDGQTLSICDDNGGYVITRALALDLPKVPAHSFPLGSRQHINHKVYSVTSNRFISLKAVQGEVPKMPALGQRFEMIEMRSPTGEVLGIDYAPTLRGQPPAASEGQSVQLGDLALSGINTESVSEKKGRQLACPQCGGQVVVKLEASKSIACQQCHSLIDLTTGQGGELRAAMQGEPIVPEIAVGSVGILQGISWQVVGYQHRMGKSAVDPDESFGWEEYLLYHPQKGFQFLVDSEDGWSLVKPATGAPVGEPDHRDVKYLGKSYAFVESYSATTEYVTGEFYWQVQRHQTTQNFDYRYRGDVLNAEVNKAEIVWSYGTTIATGTVVQAFGLDQVPSFSAKRDPAPFSDLFSGVDLNQWFIALLILFSLLMLTQCEDDCDPRTQDCSRNHSGGSYGGWSTGGGHK